MDNLGRALFSSIPLAVGAASRESPIRAPANALANASRFATGATRRLGARSEAGPPCNATPIARRQVSLVSRLSSPPSMYAAPAEPGCRDVLEGTAEYCRFW